MSESIERGLRVISDYAGDDTHGYILMSGDHESYDWGTDCAGLARLYAATVEGAALSSYPDFGTWNERQVLTGRGWKAIKFSTGAMRRGDILLRALGDSSGHTVVYIGDGLIIGAEGDWDGRRGDGSGREVCRRTYYPYDYNWILRWEEKQVAIDKVDNAIYRLYNKNAGQHHYTTNHAEAQELVGAGWTLENTDMRVKGGTVQQYRLYNPNNGAHLTTGSQGEAVELACNGWTLEGYAFKTPASGKKVIRLYNPNNGDHLYTPSETEVSSCEKAGWNNEGVAYFVND